MIFVIVYSTLLNALTIMNESDSEACDTESSR